MKSFSLPKRFWVVAIALAVMGGGFVYYFLYFVKSNQDFLIREKFRVLTLISRNISEKEKGFKKVAAQEYNRLSLDWVNVAPSRQVLAPGFHLIPKSAHSNPEFVIYPDTLYKLLNEDLNECELGLSLKSLIGTHTDHFGELVVIREIRDTVHVAYQTLDSKIKIDSLKELMLSHRGLSTGNMLDVTIADVSYKAFPHRLNFTEPGKTVEDWIIMGLVKSELLDQEAMEVKPWILFYAILVLLFIVIGMPLLKLKFMAAIERIYISNVVMTGISLVAGTAVLVQIVLSGYSFWQVQKSTDRSLKLLASHVMEEFKNEIDSITNLMYSADSSYGKIFDTLEKGQHILPSALDSANSFSEKRVLEKYPEFNSLIWLDQQGNQVLNITPKARSPKDPLPPLNEREYFKKVMNRQTWILNKKDSIVIQSIRSWVDGNTEAAISKRSTAPGIKVLVTTAKLHSVMDPILPPGYGFCIVDDKGLTLFSSNDAKNMQENFVEETNKNAELLAAMRGRASRPVSVQYLGKEHRIRIMPFYGLPLYIIAYHDIDFEKSPIILSAGLSFLAYLIIFGIMLVQLIVLFIASHQSTKLRISRFFLSWLRPHSDKASLYTYKRIILFNACVAVVLIAFLIVLSLKNIGSPKGVIAIFCLAAPNLFLAIYCELKKNRQVIGRKKFIYVSIIGIILTNFVLHTSWLNWVFQLLFWVIYFAIFQTSLPLKVPSFLQRSIDRLVDRIPLKKPLRAFTIVLFSWLMIISIIPPLYLNEMGRQIEGEIWEKYNQLEVARSIEARNKRIDTDYSKFPAAYRKMKKEQGMYYKFTGMTPWNEAGPSYITFKSQRDSVKGEEEYSHSVYGSRDSLFYPRPSLNSIIVEARESSFGNAADAAWLWYAGKDSLNFLYKVPGDKEIALASLIEPSEFNQWTKIDLWILWGELFLLSFGLYHIIHFAVRRIFAFDLVDHPRPVLLEPKNLYDVEKTCGIFIVGLPFSGKLKLLQSYQQFLKEKQVDCLEWSFSEVNNPTSRQQLIESKQQVILIPDFEFSLNDHTTAKNKLELLEKMLQFPERQIIIASDTKPESIIAFYDAMIKRTYDHRDEPEFKKDYEEYYMAKSRWKQALKSFVTLYQPLTSLSAGMEPQEGLMSHPKIAKELNHGTYLRRLLPLVTDFYNRMVHATDPAQSLTREQEEDLVLMIQSHSETYYQSIWSSLTTEEKFVLYDLAKDRLVNAQNFKVLKGLIELGLITTGRSLRMMNKSFNNFILSVVNEEEERKIDRYLRKAGNWSNIQIVLIIGMIGLVAFIALGQKEFLNNINGFLAALAGIFGLLLRLMGMVGPVGSKQ